MKITGRWEETVASTVDQDNSSGVMLSLTGDGAFDGAGDSWGDGWGDGDGECDGNGNGCGLMRGYSLRSVRHGDGTSPSPGQLFTN